MLRETRTDPGAPGKHVAFQRQEFSDEAPRGLRGDSDDEEAPMSCYCFGMPGISWCDSGPIVEESSEMRPPAAGSGARGTRGRALRVLVVGSSSEKQRVIDTLRAGGSQSRRTAATSVGSKFASVKRRSVGPSGKSMLIFNDVPSRDLDRPRCNSDFEAYLQRASCALVVVDANDHNWVKDGCRWVERLADSARVPVALLVDCVNQTASASSLEDTRKSVAQRAEVMRARSELPFVGWFVASDDILVDETSACVAAIVEHIDNDQSAQGGASLSFLSPTPTKSRMSARSGPRPSPGTYADSVNAVVSPPLASPL